MTPQPGAVPPLQSSRRYGMNASCDASADECKAWECSITKGSDDGRPIMMNNMADDQGGSCR